MKAYFAKHLPVEGEIEEGDFYVTAPDYKNIRKCEDKSWGTFEMCKKVKLFLCSRDIQVGDILSCVVKGELITAPEPITESQLQYINKDSWYKIIGEISLEATWVKEEDEFDQTEVLRIAKGIGNPVNSEFHVYQIKGPCGHYH